MYINGIDVASFGAEFIEKKISTAQFEFNSEWARNSLNPVIYNKKNYYIPIEILLIVKGDTIQEVTEKTGALLKKLEMCTLNFDDLDYYYDCILNSKINEQFGIDILEEKQIEKITVTLMCYLKYKTEIIETADRVSTKTINVPGTLESPVIVEIIPSVNLAEFIVTGLGETFKIKNLLSGQKVIVNGEDCTVLQGTINKFPDYDSWDFPIISPGSKTITFSSIGCDVSIKYKPRWI